jgi:hypothetical protein
MFKASISSTDAKATAQATADALISASKDARALGLSFLESSMPVGSALMSKMTAAAHTGPAQGPRPASSTPQTGAG